MSGNARIFANLKENFNQYDLLYMEPLSYIRALIGDAIDANKPPKIMLLCKKVLANFEQYAFKITLHTLCTIIK